MLSNDRICDLADDLRNHVFEMLDAEPEMTGADAGKVAHEVEEAFKTAIEHLQMTIEEKQRRGLVCGPLVHIPQPGPNDDPTEVW